MSEPYPPVTRVWWIKPDEPFTAPQTATTGRIPGDERVHKLFAPFDPWMLRPLTHCGRTAREIPGGDEVTCRECLEAMD